MPALITELIDKTDNFEVIRDQIAAILKVESVNQVALATTAGKARPEDWALRVFVERSNPWELFLSEEDVEDDTKDRSPVANVWFQRMTFDGMKSDAVERQMASGTFRIDCYGCGVSRGRNGGGHDAGDEFASREVQRAIRWCRNILMSAHYFRLGFPVPNRVFGKRFPESIEIFQPRLDERAAQQVVGASFALTVDFNEFSPQVVGQPLELISTEVRRDTVTGELLLTVDTSFTS